MLTPKQLTVAVVALLLASSGTARAEPAPFDEVAKVTDGAATFGRNLGEFVVDRAELRRLPKAEHLAKAESNPNDHWNPFLKLIVSNPKQAKAILSFTVKLEDASGASLFEGSKSLTTDPGKKVLEVDLDPSIPLRLGTWKSLAQVHVVASVTPLTLDQSFPLAASETTVGMKVGNVLVEKVALVNAPTAAELEQALADPSLKTRPKVSLVLGNSSDDKVKVRMRVILEDESGAAYMDCGWQTEKLAPRARSKSVTQCGGGVRMKTAEWPKVTRAHVSVQVD